MQHHPAEHLDVVMALAECALGAFADGREGFDQHVVQRFAVSEALFEIFGARTQLVVGQFFDVRFQRIDLADHCLKPFDFPIIGAAEKTLRNRL